MVRGSAAVMPMSKPAGADVQGPTSKRSLAGTISGGGPLVRVNSPGGAVRITIAPGP